MFDLVFYSQAFYYDTEVNLNEEGNKWMNEFRNEERITKRINRNTINEWNNKQTNE